MRIDLKFVVSDLSAAFIAASPAAHAATEDWYSRDKPLNAYDDGVSQGQADGTSYTKDSLLKNHTYWRDPRSGGDAVYTQSDYAYHQIGQTSETSASWCDKEGKDQSARSTSSSWKDQYDADDDTDDHYQADQGRVFSKVCEDHSWSPDACSRNPWVTFGI